MGSISFKHHPGLLAMGARPDSKVIIALSQFQFFKEDLVHQIIVMLPRMNQYLLNRLF